MVDVDDEEREKECSEKGDAAAATEVAALLDGAGGRATAKTNKNKNKKAFSTNPAFAFSSFTSAAVAANSLRTATVGVQTPPNLAALRPQRKMTMQSMETRKKHITGLTREEGRAESRRRRRRRRRRKRVGKAALPLLTLVGPGAKSRLLGA